MASRDEINAAKSWFYCMPEDMSRGSKPHGCVLADALTDCERERGRYRAVLKGAGYAVTAMDDNDLTPKQARTCGKMAAERTQQIAAERDRLAERNRELVEALKWYADESNHFPRTVHRWAMEHGEKFAPIYGDLGEKARAALAKEKEEQNG